MIMELNAQCVDIALFPRCASTAQAKAHSRPNALINECEEALWK